MLSSRCDELPHDKAGHLEYAVHGLFKMSGDGYAFPDTHWFTLIELKEAGASKAELRKACRYYEAELEEANDAHLDALSADEEGEEGEDDEDDKEREGTGVAPSSGGRRG